MGQRANLIIIENGRQEVYYTHHRANTLDHDLFWGAIFALGFARAQQPVNPPNFLDEVWAEGGAIIDVDRHVLLWWGGEDIAYDVPLRRVHAELMSVLWTGWNVRWAYQGVVDLADYLGFSRSVVLSSQAEPFNERFTAEVAVRPALGDFWSTVASLRITPSEVRMSLLKNTLEQLLYLGESIAGAAVAAARGTSIDLSSEKSFPSGGLHMDLFRKSLDFWTARPEAEIVKRVQEAWPRWTVAWHRDHFESQLERTDSMLQLPNRSKAALIDQWRAALLRPYPEKSGAESIVEVAKLMAGSGDVEKVHINPAALCDAQLQLQLARRIALFQHAANQI